MNRKALSAIPLALPLVGMLLAASAQAATPGPAIPGKAGVPAAAPAPAGAAADTAKAPIGPSAAIKGYTQVTSALLSDPANAQTSGSVACPSGTVPVGGGALISSSSLSENLNGSLPFNGGWLVYVNNSSGTAGTFRVFVDCVTSVNGYQVLSGTGVDNASGAQTVATVTCPGKTKPLGGGGLGSSGSTLVNLNSSLPQTTGWRVDVNNASAGSDTATAYVVCGKKPPKYAVVSSGSPTTIAANSQSSNSVACPSGTVVFGGGGFSNSGSTSVNLNSSLPNGNGSWTAYENNATSGTNTLTAYAVCARVAS